jgi:hypothetical protein
MLVYCFVYQLLIIYLRAIAQFGGRAIPRSPNCMRPVDVQWPNVETAGVPRARCASRLENKLRSVR